jgi:hypothetical protein
MLNTTSYGILLLANLNARTHRPLPVVTEETGAHNHAAPHLPDSESTMAGSNDPISPATEYVSQRDAEVQQTDESLTGTVRDSK